MSPSFRSVLLPAIALAGSTLLPAQLPTGSVLVLQGPPVPFGFDEYAVIDAAGGGATVLPLQGGPLLLSTARAFAPDPANATRLFLLNDQNGIDPGIKLATVGAMSRVTGLPSGQLWTQAGGDEVEVGTTRVFTLRAGGIVEATPKAGGAPFPLLQLPNAIDLALAEPFLYVACNDPANPAPLVEFDLTTGVQRTVGSFLGLTAVARSRSNAELAVGTASGFVLELDVGTGAVLASFSAGTGAVRGLEYTDAAELIYAVDSGTGFVVGSQLTPVPIFVGTGNFKDLAVANAVTASVVQYGSGCGQASSLAWDTVSLPTPGNAQFTLLISAAPVVSPLALFLGGDRYLSSVFGAPLPIDLQPFGAPGCTLLVDPLVPLVVVTDGLGNAAQTIPIPAGPQLLGREFQAQCAAPDIGVQPLGFATGPGVAFRIN